MESKARTGSSRSSDPSNFSSWNKQCRREAGTAVDAQQRPKSRHAEGAFVISNEETVAVVVDSKDTAMLEPPSTPWFLESQLIAQLPEPDDVCKGVLAASISYSITQSNAKGSSQHRAAYKQQGTPNAWHYQRLML